uniref:4-hydroxyphenylpyruvate dioxygenase n=1 Tax=Chenopodium quinoa TaxID=63459 RepID=A0A803N2E9_CHEQI
MPTVAKSDHSTGNLVHASYVLRSGDLRFLFTAPYTQSSSPTASIPTFNYESHSSFMSNSWVLEFALLPLRWTMLKSAYATSVAAGARPSSPPILLEDGHTLLAEVHLFGDVVLRLVSHAHTSICNNFLPKFYSSTWIRNRIRVQ